MAWMTKDIKINEEKFETAAKDMRTLKRRTENLKKKLEGMYNDLSKAINTEAGSELKLEAKSVLLEPVEDMAKVVGHISETLDTIIGSGYYKDVFTGFEDLKNII